MSNEIFVAFATQKGGIGKSTVTALAANYLHNVKGYNVAVIDCDDPQHSIHGLRERETKLIDESLYFKALACDHFRKVRKNAYPVIKSNSQDALDDADRMLVSEEVKPDIVFFDMPGTLRSDGVVKTLSQMDYIFTPMSADRFVVESTLQFAVMFRDNLMTTGQAKTKGLYLFWTMVDGREKNGLYDLYEDVIAEMGLSVLSTRLPDSKKFRRDLSEERKGVFRSTIFPMDTSLLKGSGIREFSEEIYFDVIRKKTAALFAASAESGAISVDAADKDVADATLFGELIGIAFQIKDDIFDYFDSDAIGKPTGNDMLEGKLTLPALYVLNKTTDSSVKETALRIRALEATKEEISDFVLYVKEHGGIEYARETMMKYRDKAIELLPASGDKAIKESLTAYVDYVIQRDK